MNRHSAPAPALEGECVFACNAPRGVGGLGQHGDHVARALADVVPQIRRYGPDVEPGPVRSGVRSEVPATAVAGWRRRHTWLRYLTGRYQLEIDTRFGRWLASECSRRPFGRGYYFTQIARESLAHARERGAFTILDCPNGHIRDFREQLCRESEQWTGWPYLGHPNEPMVARVEDEYRLADSIRVSSQWARRSLVRGGVDEHKIFVVPQPIDVNRFVPATAGPAAGALRLVFVGSISLGKGFQYLLTAMSRLGGQHFSLEMVGATGDLWCRRLLGRLQAGLDVLHAPGDPLAAYQRGELFVLPSLHDGFGLVVGEAMACGLPVITTDSCGASEWIRPAESGWVVPRGDQDALVTALENALARRSSLQEMGRQARRDVERLNADAVNRRLQQHVRDRWRLDAAHAVGA